MFFLSFFVVKVSFFVFEFSLDPPIILCYPLSLSQNGFTCCQLLICLFFLFLLLLQSCTCSNRRSNQIDSPAMSVFKFSRSSYAMLLLAIVVLNLVLISHYQVEASKKKMMKKLKKMLPLLLALKSKKKIFLVNIVPIALP